MPESSQRLYAEVLNAAWEQMADELVQRELKRLVDALTVKTAVKAKIKKEFPTIVEWAMLDMFDIPAFQAAMATAYGLPALNGPVAKRLQELGQRARGTPRGELRNKVYQEMERLILDAGHFTWVDALRDYWFASVLGRFQTIENILLGNFVTGAIRNMTNAAALLARGKPRQMAKFIIDYWAAMPEGVLALYDTITTGDRTKQDDFEEKATAFFEGGAKGHRVRPTETIFDYWARTAKWTTQPTRRALSTLRYVGRLLAGIDRISSYGTAAASKRFAAVVRDDTAALALLDQKYNAKLTKAADAQARRELQESGIANPKLVDVLHRRREILEEGISDEIREYGVQSARSVAAQLEPRSLAGKALMSYVNKMSWGTRGALGLSFARAMVSLAENAIEFTPGSIAVPLLRQYASPEAKWGELELRNDWTPERKAEYIAAQMAGLSLGIAVAMLVLRRDPDDDDDGLEVTGAWDGLTTAQKNQRRAVGEREYGIRFHKNGKMIPLTMLGPFMPVLAMIGQMRDMQRFHKKDWSEQGIAHRMFNAYAAGVMSVTQLPVVSQLAGFFKGEETDVASRINAAAARMGGNFLGGFAPSTLKDIDTVLDPNLYRPDKESKGIEYWLRYWPFFRRDIGGGLPALDAKGDTVKMARLPFHRFIGDEKLRDPFWQAAGELGSRGVFLPDPPDVSIVDASGVRREMTRLEKWHYERAYFKARAGFVEAGAEWLKHATDEEAKSELRNLHDYIVARLPRLTEDELQQQ